MILAASIRIRIIVSSTDSDSLRPSIGESQLK